MDRLRYTAITLVAALFVAGSGEALAMPQAGGAASEKQRACQALTGIRNLTIISASLVNAKGTTPEYCYVRGLMQPAIHFHVQLPLPENWNGRFLHIGDGGTDGDLDFSDQRLAQGYAVANSNTGHDTGSEPGASFGYNNRQAEIDFGHRAMHLTVEAGKTLVRNYYGSAPRYSYHEGCSGGGRQGLMAAQRYPHDFDGIVAGHAPFRFQDRDASNIWTMQKLFREGFAGNLAFDTNGDGSFDSLRKVDILREAVLAKCDARDGIRDGVIQDPRQCDFNPKADLAGKMCLRNINGEACFTAAQVATIEAIYGGVRDSKGTLILKGRAPGSEFAWPADLIPHAGNSLLPGELYYSGDHLNYLFYETDPGVAPPDLTDLSHKVDKSKNPPEFAWWEFNVDDVTAGKGRLMSSILDAKDPNLSAYLKSNGGKLLMYHGWGDAQIPPEPIMDYFDDTVKATFAGDVKAAQQGFRLFMVPGLGHCRGGPGPDTWDKLE
ncbi:MAG: tannase/feruloyl esterase family alpha/beta hydrolase, partial [Terriglobia bacterium]